ncbi:hypothetical protein [Streptomyces sp. NRRL B-24484]|uniref:hypothetical protein n=1 Tax=Streptomyces sp. NRRL B-24484 TaxID=1463833 RepID=UPI0004C034B3|nr:hypothetical protein [Streptomyces sp. NRRL B-24484]
MRFDEAVRARQRDVPLRYALVGGEWDGEQTLWAGCADMDGLSVDRVPRRETLTLVGCRPAGRLLKAADRARREPVELGHLFVPVGFPDGHPDAWDGRFVTDVPGFRCALGEAVAGPGRHPHQCWGCSWAVPAAARRSGGRSP